MTSYSPASDNPTGKAEKAKQLKKVHILLRLTFRPPANSRRTLPTARRNAKTRPSSRTPGVSHTTFLLPLTARADLEAEINDLKARDKLSNEAQERLSSLKSELAYVTKLKDKYVAKHPGERDKVFHKEGRDNRASGRWHSGDGNDDGEEGAEGEGSARPRVPRQARPDPTAHLYNADGTLKDPRRSYYYDATYNPFGVPPPGMPYRERSEYRVMWWVAG